MKGRLMRTYKYTTLFVMLLLGFAVCFADAAEEQKLIDTLKSDGPLLDRVQACQRLYEIGTKAAVPTLVELLYDDELCYHARTVLEVIDDASVDDAFRKALGKMSGEQLAGVIYSVGTRQDAEAVPKLIEFASGSDAVVAVAAVTSLGRIATDDAVGAVLGALKSQFDTVRGAAADSCFTIADKLEGSRAVKIYEAIANANVSGYVQDAAKLNMIVLKDQAAMPMLVGLLRSGDSAKVNMAVGAIRRMGDSLDYTQVVEAMPSLNPVMQVTMIEAMTVKGGAAVKNMIERLAVSDNEQVCVAAVKALGQIGDASSVNVIVRSSQQHGVSIKYLEDYLVVMEGSGVDKEILNAFKKSKGRIRVSLAKVLGLRRYREAYSLLLAETTSDDFGLAISAFQSACLMARADDVMELTKQLMVIDNDNVRGVAERAVVSVVKKNDDVQNRCDGIIELLGKVKETEDRCSLLSILGWTPNDKGLTELVKAVDDSDSQVRKTAIVMLTKWPDARACDALGKVVANTDDPSIRSIAFRGYVKIIEADKTHSHKQKAAYLKRATDWAKTEEQQKLLLGVVGQVRDAQAVEIACSFLKNPEVEAEAFIAVFTTVGFIKKAEPQKALEAAYKVKAWTKKNHGWADSIIKEFGRFGKIFDGKTFDGWEGNLDMFRIEDGAIVGGTLKEKIPRNEFLCTKSVYSDFELKLKVKLLGDNANAGIQIRSRRIPNHHEMIGYQADMGQQYWGCLYDESRRRKVLASPNKTELTKVLKQGEWNDYRIRCKGKRVQLWINGYQTVDYVEPDDSIEQAGLIGVQIHSGGPSEAWYKDITIKQL